MWVVSVFIDSAPKDMERFRFRSHAEQYQQQLRRIMGDKYHFAISFDAEAINDLL